MSNAAGRDLPIWPAAVATLFLVLIIGMAVSIAV